MRRFFIDGELGDSLCIVGEDAHHIVHVLRMKIGDTIIVVSNNGHSCEAKIEQISASQVLAQRVRDISENREPSVNVVLAQALTKSDKMDYIIQKAVELGVTKIVPLELAHCVVKYDNAKKDSRQQRWQKIAGEAAKQCKRSLIPVVSGICCLQEFLKDFSANCVLIMPYEGAEQFGLKKLLKTYQEDTYVIIIGPEGGFSSAEVQLCLEYGVNIVTLGPRILRTETASLVALSIVMYECGDIGGGC